MFRPCSSLRCGKRERSKLKIPCSVAPPVHPQARLQELIGHNETLKSSLEAERHKLNGLQAGLTAETENLRRLEAALRSKDLEIQLRLKEIEHSGLLKEQALAAREKAVANGEEDVAKLRAKLEADRAALAEAVAETEAARAALKAQAAALRQSEDALELRRQVGAVLFLHLLSAVSQALVVCATACVLYDAVTFRTAPKARLHGCFPTTNTTTSAATPLTHLPPTPLFHPIGDLPSGRLAGSQAAGGDGRRGSGRGTPAGHG